MFPLILYSLCKNNFLSHVFHFISGDFGCTFDVQRVLPVLKRTYGDNMRKVLHVGPDTCSVLSQLMKEPEIEAWGVEPYDIEEANTHCKNLVRRGLVRVADIKFPLPYRAKSFSLVIVSDAADYLSPKYLNNTIQDLARITVQNLVIFTGKLLNTIKIYGHFCYFSPKLKPLNLGPCGFNFIDIFIQKQNLVRFFGNPIHSNARVARQPKFGHPVKGETRSKTWWERFFVQTSLEENDDATMKFKQAAFEISYKPRCQVFHLNSYH
ncbi:putative pectin methyltransferase CGR2/3 [Helianthus annuus]|nr:putative pectin methyltransferase CGR2/3 [Helianthus annuus]